MTEARPVALSMRGISKAFGSTLALKKVDLEVEEGEVHALVGENGAGKSTLMKVLSGAHRPDSGTMALHSKPYAPKGPLDGRRHGVAMIYQELNLAPHLSVEDNVMLGVERSRYFVRQRGLDRPRIENALAILEHPEISPTRKVGDLSQAARQLVEVARALVAQCRVIVMDEPTSSLTQKDTERLFSVIDRLRQDGVAVVYISHFLDEIERIADRFTVLRDGETVGTGVVRETTMDAIVETMVGRKLKEVYPKIPHQRGEPILQLDALRGDPLPIEASLTLHRGEIFGIAGLVGAGRTELMRALFGLDAIKSGRVTVEGTVDTGRSPRERLDQGLGLLPEDRKDEALALNMSIEENLTLSDFRPFSRGSVLNLRDRKRCAQKWIERLSIKCRDAGQAVLDLSGGNQQKVALARLLHHDVDILLLDEPTRGVDVGSKVEIYRLISELAAQGKAILVVSSYVPELLGLCDRLAVMARGTLTTAFETKGLDEASVLSLATAASEDSTAE